MRSSNKVYMEASIKHANMTPLSLMGLFLIAKLNNKLLDATFVAERWQTRRSMESRDYSQLLYRVDQLVTQCSLGVISGGHPMMKVFQIWDVTGGKLLVYIRFLFRRACLEAFHLILSLVSFILCCFLRCLSLVLLLDYSMIKTAS